MGDCEANRSSCHAAFVVHEAVHLEAPLSIHIVQPLLAVVQPFVSLHSLHMEMNPGLLSDRKVVYALDHNPHNVMQYNLVMLKLLWGTVS